MQPTTLSWTSKMTVYVMGLVLGGILLTGLAMAQSTPPPANSFLATGTYRLTVTDRELSLDAAEASLAAILADIEQHTGIPIVVYSGMTERVTIHLSQMPLDKPSNSSCLMWRSRRHRARTLRHIALPKSMCYPRARTN